MRAVCARAAAIDWRAAIAGLRPHTERMWLAASYDEQRRFIRHLRPWRDVHRHRLAPPVAARVRALQENGNLQVVAGRSTGCPAVHGKIDFAWRPRGRQSDEHLIVRRVISCTGPQGDLLRTRESLLHLLLASGHARPDPPRLGIDVNAQVQTIDVNGRTNPRLLATGPMTRGAFWEMVAVPAIRRQTWALARRLALAEWPGGEGL